MVNPESIRKAVLAHAEWKTRLQRAIDTGKVDVSVAHVRSDSNCQFGQWLHGNELTPADKQTENYTSVLQLHARFHEEASKVVQLVLVSRTEEARKAIGLLGDYATASAALTNALAKWQTALGR